MLQRHFLRSGKVLGTFKLDVATVMAQPGIQKYPNTIIFVCILKYPLHNKKFSSQFISTHTCICTSKDYFLSTHATIHFSLSKTDYVHLLLLGYLINLDGLSLIILEFGCAWTISSIFPGVVLISTKKLDLSRHLLYYVWIISTPLSPYRESSNKSPPQGLGLRRTEG